ncbi:MAG: S-methyl-5-thioribose-1-phosphate isomerase [Phycisphaeraceae bacterium]|nr:S-methyl-5-thioribose-1-phosphate isomerase [Phycisphaeraceae bacterium]
MKVPPTIRWVGNASAGHLELLDQTQLPTVVAYLQFTEVSPLVEAIRRLVVRGAPAIGIAAGYGCVLGVSRGHEHGLQPSEALAQAAQALNASRPTAVNLAWALERMRRVKPINPERLLREAMAIHEEDAGLCREIGEHGLGLLREMFPDRGEPERPLRLLTHCNAGALATGGCGTATALIYAAAESGLAVEVFASETRPLWQGARLTAWELNQAGIQTTVVCDNMVGALMAAGHVDAVIVGADRIAANGDVANKIGTYGLAVIAKHHSVPMFVAAPYSTFDRKIESGRTIPIEQRDPLEVTRPASHWIAAPQTPAWNPAFDVTPAALIHALITDQGTVQPVSGENIKSILAAAPHGARD